MFALAFVSGGLVMICTRLIFCKQRLNRGLLAGCIDIQGEHIQKLSTSGNFSMNVIIKEMAS